jgi:phosphoribosylformimino-5-aminoimidazole carboxamide ribotide isomerase
LAKLKVESVVVGKAIYEGRVTIEEIKNWNLESLMSI